MADIVNREPKKEELDAVLALVWREWSKEEDPADLTVEKLQELLRSNAMEPLWAVWVTANLNLVEEYGAKQNESNIAAAFLLFFNNWSRDLSERWSYRVQEYRREWAQQQQPLPTTTSRIPTIGEPLPVLDTHPKPPLPPWKDAREIVVQPYDTRREAATVLVESHTDGERDAARKVEQTGIRLVAIWRTEPACCIACWPNEGRLCSEVGFPPLHKNCDCYAEWNPYSSDGSYPAKGPTSVSL